MALFSLVPWAIALLLLGLDALPMPKGRSAAVYDRVARFPLSAAQGSPRNASSVVDLEKREWMRDCPCSRWHSGPSASQLCLPVSWSSPQRWSPRKKEVFAFSIATDDRWKHYDWDLLTTVAWNTDAEMMCHAHDKGVLVVVKHNFEDVTQLCDLTARREWIEATYVLIATNHADGVNIDTEAAMNGATAKCLAELVAELRDELQRHPMTQYAQITFDVSWAPRGVDGRYYPWKKLADVVDFLFVMSYDMRSQIYDACVAGANAPRALVQQGIDEFLLSVGVPADKLVLGVPWYGYEYECESNSDQGDRTDSKVCRIPAVPFFGAPCSDAAGKQLDFAAIKELIRSKRLTEQWDELTESPFVWISRHGSSLSGSPRMIWFDDPTSLKHKLGLVRSAGLRGAGMWHVDALNYSAAEGTAAYNDTQLMWQTLGAAVAPLRRAD